MNLRMLLECILPSARLAPRFPPPTARRNQASHPRLPTCQPPPQITVSFGNVVSLISMPCYMSHASIPAEVRAARGLPDDLVRISGVCGGGAGGRAGVGHGCGWRASREGHAGARAVHQFGVHGTRKACMGHTWRAGITAVGRW